MNINDCSFVGNRAIGGASIFIFEIVESSYFLIQDCTFQDNVIVKVNAAKSFDGGAIALLNLANARINITGCAFNNNKAIKTNGGAFSASFTTKNCSILLLNSTFRHNFAGYRGGVSFVDFMTICQSLF